MCFHFDLYRKILSGINLLVIFIVSFISFLFVFFQRSLYYFIISIQLFKRKLNLITKILDLRYRNPSFYQAHAGQLTNVVNFRSIMFGLLGFWSLYHYIIFLTLGKEQKDQFLRANAQKNRAKSANRGHSSKPNLTSFSVCNKVLMSL